MPLRLTLQPTGQALTVPTSWADVTLAQFVALHAAEPGDSRTVPELLLGLEAGALNQLAADDVPLLATLIAFASDPSPVLALLPPPGLPDVGSLPYGCLVLCQQEFERNAERPLLASFPYVLAVYRCQRTWGSTDRLAETLAAVLAAPCTEVWAEAQAFTTACRNWRPGTRPTPTGIVGSPKRRNWKQAVRSWLRDLGRRFPWTPSLPETS